MSVIVVMGWLMLLVIDAVGGGWRCRCLMGVLIRKALLGLIWWCECNSFGLWIPVRRRINSITGDPV